MKKEAGLGTVFPTPGHVVGRAYGLATRFLPVHPVGPQPEAEKIVHRLVQNLGAWVADAAAGWGLQATGLENTWGIIGTVMIYLSPILWIVAFAMFRKEKAASEPPSPGSEYSQEGVWPPPPRR